MGEDIRWKQRFDNFSRAYASLRKAVELSQERPLTELEQQGLIHGFEFTHELAWNVLKDYLEAKGISGLIGSRDATRHAFRNGLIEDGDTWMEMIKARNLTSHAYDPEIAARIARDVLSRFQPVFAQMSRTFSELAQAPEA